MEFYVNVAELARNAQSNEKYRGSDIQYRVYDRWNIGSFIGAMNQERI